MSDTCLASIKINVVVYRPNDTEADGYNIILVDADSFISELSGENDHECSKEIKKLLEETKENWQK
tara:strand:- start:232 stop:429 length:198 start_codon:yes stop_codon:yes gene_type:complete